MSDWDNRLALLRSEIDRIDEEILRLYRERLRVCREIGRVKALIGAPLEDGVREAVVLSRARSLWERVLMIVIVESCKSVQRGLADAYLE